MKQLQSAARFALFALLTALFSAPLYSASILDIGTDYRLRGISTSKADFGATPDNDYAYMSQRLQAYIGARFSPNIEFMTKFQALGVAGSSGSVDSPTVNQAGQRYPNTDFTPWVQNAYFKVGRFYDWPTDITVGRQPMMLGDGFLLSDDELGFTGVRLQSRLPIYGMRADMFWFKAGDTLASQATDTDIYGAEVSKPFRNVRLSGLWVTERDASGQSLYVRPSENAEDLNRYPTGTDFRASRITRTFYDARIEARLSEGGFMKAEAAIQTGSVSRSSSSLGAVDLGGYAFLVSGGLFTRFSKYGPIEVHGSFGIASGDSGDSKDNSFRPSFGRKFDGMERSGFGEFYGATLYDAASSSANPSGLPPGFSGLRVIGAGVTAHPTALISVGIDYFVYDAQEAAGPQFPVSSSESGLGSELDFGLGFAYTNYLSFRFSAAFFSPGEAYEHRDKAQRFLLEAIGRF